MGYLFLTGATGLLGSYLVRDLSRAGVKLVVLVRRTRYLSAQHRVETLLARWEKQAGHALPRPVVLEGDLSDPTLGLAEAELAWVAENCTALMHNAASLTFHSESRDEEPWRSNLYGTEHVLEFCRRTGIRQFHHVSTAYVCGLRDDRVYENELDVGQTHGNDYEIAKFEAEKRVRGAEFLDSLTVYRPAIILGDSQTGYTTTYHGFYVPLKLVSTVISKSAAVGTPRELIYAGVRMASERLRKLMNLTGVESKNYVPVEWVSAVMQHIFTHPEHHGKTYHLTPSERVKLSLTQEVMERAISRYVELTSAVSENTYDWNEFEQFFLEGMNVYRSYWRDDPTFDFTNTDAAAPHLPCPILDSEMIMRLCRFAIESNFGWPRPPVVRPEFDVHERLKGLTRNGSPHSPASTGTVFLGLQVNGRGGGQWELTLNDGDVVSAAQGLSSRCTATYYLNTQTLERLSTRKLSADQAVRAGRVLIEGNGVPLPELTRVLERLAVDKLVPMTGEESVS